MRPLRVSELVQQAWVRGVSRGDGAPLREAVRFSADDPLLEELRCFAAIATMLDDDPPDTIDGLRELGAGDDARAPCVWVLIDAVRTWIACQRRDVDAALRGLDELSTTLARARAESPADARLPAAAAWADLAIAESALVGGDRVAADARLRAVLDQQNAPPAACLAATIRRATRLLGFERPAEALRALDDAATLARRIDAGHEVALAGIYGGMYALAAGDRAGARRRIDPIVDHPDTALPARYATFGRVLRAATRDGDEGLADLAEGVGQAATAGDYGSYVLLIMTGVRQYIDRGDATRAVLTLSTAIGQLRRVDSSDLLAEPLLAERERIRSALGEATYQRIAAAALAELERARVPPRA